MSEVQSFFASIYSAILRKNGYVLAKLLSLPYHDHNLTPQLRSTLIKLQGTDVTSLCSSQYEDGNLGVMVAQAVNAKVHFLAKNLEAAYKSESAAYDAIVNFFSNKNDNTNWIIPTLSRISNDLRLVAQMTDDEAKDINNKYLRESLNALTRGYTVVARDKTPIKTPGAKKIAMFVVTNVLLKVYFKMNTLQLCGRLTTVIETPGGVMEHYQQFPISDVVMYKYYIGRIRMFEDKFEEARTYLHFALNNTPRNQVRNRQRILASLIPIEMNLGIMPSPKVATDYGFHEFVMLGEAVKRGDVMSFQRIMDENQTTFVQHGVYLVLEYVRMIAYRNLFRKVYLLQNSNTKLMLQSFEVALQYLGEEADTDSVECLLANLIFQGRVKGYISHEKKFMIVSKTEAFPTTAVIKKKN